MSGDERELSGLIERVLGGESAAWHELWHRVEPVVWRITGKWQIAGPLCRSADDRRDIVLRVMERLREGDFRRLRGFAASRGGGHDGAFRAWLATLAARVAVDHVRSHPEHVDKRGRRGDERVPTHRTLAMQTRNVADLDEVASPVDGRVGRHSPHGLREPPDPGTGRARSA